MVDLPILLLFFNYYFFKYYSNKLCYLQVDSRYHQEAQFIHYLVTMVLLLEFVVVCCCVAVVMTHAAFRYIDTALPIGIKMC